MTWRVTVPEKRGPPRAKAKATRRAGGRSCLAVSLHVRHSRPGPGRELACSSMVT